MVAALGVFVACEKDEFEALDQAFAQEINRLDAADDVLQSNIDDLRSDFDAFVIAINEKIDAAVAALEAADEALEAYINSEISDLNNELTQKIEDLDDKLTASIKKNFEIFKEVTEELAKAISTESIARAAGDLEIANELADQVGKLEKQDSILLGHIYSNIRGISAVNSRLSSHIVAYNTKIEELEDQDDIHTLDIAGLTSDFASLNGQVGTLRGLHNTLSDNHDGLVTTVSDLSDSHGELGGTVSNTVSDIQRLINDLASEETDRIASFNDLNTRLGALVSTVNTNADTASSSLSNAITNFNNALDGVRTAFANGDLSVARVAQANLAAAQTALQAAIDANGASITNLGTRIDGVMSTLTSEVARLEGLINAAVGVNDAQARLLTSLRTDLDAARTLLANTIAANATQAELDEVISDIEALTARVVAVEAFRSRIEMLEATSSALQLSVTAQGSTDGNHASTLTLIQSSISALETTLETYADNGDETLRIALQTEIDRVERELGVLITNNANAITSLRDDLTSLQGTVSGLNFVSPGELATEITALETLISSTNSATIANIAGIRLQLNDIVLSVQALRAVDNTLSTATASNTADVAALETRVNAIEGVSASYDPSTGILSITLANGNTYPTGDLRGPAGPAGVQGIRGFTGATGETGPQGPAGADGAQGPAGVNGQDGATGPAGPAGSGSGGSVSIVWGPDFVDQIADFTQTGNLDGASLTRLVSVVEGHPVNTPGATTTVVTYDGFATLAEAQAAITAVGTHQIVMSTITTIADGTSVITYRATADNGNITIGSHDVSSVLAGSSSTVNVDVEYVVSPAASISFPNGNSIDYTVGSGPAVIAVTGTGGQLQFVNGEGGTTDVTGGSFTIPFELTYNAPFARVYTFQIAGTNVRETITINLLPAPVVDQADEITSSTSSSRAGGISTTVNDGAPVITLGTAGSSVASVTETTTQNTLINTTAVIETVVTTFAVQVNGVEDTPALVAPASTSVDTEITPASSVAGTPIVTTRMIANPDYQAPTTGGGDAIAGTLNFTSNFAGLGVLGFTATYTVNGQAGVTSIDFTEAGTYTIAVANSVGPVGTADIVVDASDDAGTYHITADASGVTITKQ